MIMTNKVRPQISWVGVFSNALLPLEPYFLNKQNNGKVWFINKMLKVEP